MIAHEMDHNKQNDNENQDQTVKHSDFSIDHILNRAGRSFANGEKSVECAKVRENMEKFQWLQCSRYCPPRIPRIHKKDVQKRQLGRHPRIPFTSYQLLILEQKFKESPYLSSEEVIVLSKKLQLADIRVKIWFQNRRARERRERNGIFCDNKPKEDSRKPGQEDRNENRLLSTPCMDMRHVAVGSTKISSDELPNQNVLVTTIKSEVPLDCSNHPVFSTKNLSEIVATSCSSSPYFLTNNVPFLVENVHFLNNKDAEF